MSYPPLATGMIIGGVVISAIGAASTKFVEQKAPTTKTLGRDFIIGAVMVAMIIQLLPESSSSLIQFLLGLAPLTLFKSVQQVVEVEEEVKVGVPRF